MKSKKKKIISTEFLWAFFCTIIGLSIYILGKKVIPFPEKWIGANLNKSLFFLGIFSHLTVGWILNLFFLFFDQEKHGQEKIQKLRNNLSRILILLLFIISGLLSYWTDVEKSLTNILFLILILAVISCCIDAIIQFMNKYGVCNGFSLLLFTEFLPARWLSSVLWPNIRTNWQSNNWIREGLLQQPWFCIILLLAITAFFVWIVNVKWEAPVENNSSYFVGNPLIKENRFPLGFKMSFSFMHLFYLSQMLRWIYFLIKLIKIDSSFSFSSIINNAGKINTDLHVDSLIWKGSSESFRGECLFLLNNKKRLFGELFQWVNEQKWMILFALLVLLFLRWLSTWTSVRKFNWKTKDISKNLQRRGIYLHNIPSGKWTRELLKKVINRLIFCWIMIVIFFQIIFDQIFTNLEKKKIDFLCEQEREIVPLYLSSPDFTFFTSFIDWFGSVVIGVEIYQQIKTKYEYTQRK